VYAFALILWEICTHKRVYPNFGDDDFELFCAAICDRDMRPFFSNRVPPVLEPIMNLCWSKDPAQRPSFLELIPMLDDAKIRYYLKDPSEIDFWKSNFPLKVKVPFTEFVDKLWKHHSKVFNTQKSRCDFLTSLNDIIGSDAQIPFSHVWLSAYKKLIAWFGPLFSEKKPNFKEFCEIMKKPWYFNTIPGGPHAELALTSNTKGLFIVRRTPDILQEERIHYPFTIDYFNGGFVHHRVSRSPNGLYHLVFNGVIYKKESLIGLIETLMTDAPLVFSGPVVLKNKVDYRIDVIIL